MTADTSFKRRISRARNPWFVLVFFWLIYFLNQADRQVLFSVLPLIKHELRVTDALLGLISSVFFWVFAILVPLAGSLGDIVSRKRLIVAALLVWSAATGASGIAAGFLWLVICRGATAFGEAFYYPCASSMIGDYHGEKTRATAMAVHQTSVYTGIIVSGALAGYIGEHYGWRTAFLGFGAMGMIVALVSAVALEEPKRGQSEQVGYSGAGVSLQGRLAETFQTPTAVMLALAFLGMILVNTAYLTWTPSLLVRKFGLSLAEAGFHATFWHHVGAALGVLAGGKVADVLAARSVMSRPLIQLAGLFLGAPFIFLLGWSTSRTVVYASLGLFGIFRGLYDSNLLPSLYEVIRPQSRATSTGIMIGAAFLGGGFAPLAIGWLSDRMSLGSALSGMSLCYLLSGVIIAFDCALFYRKDSLRMRMSMRRAEGAARP
jgi:MFS family permease